MPEQVRYHMLRPHQIVERRKACPVAYLPIGTIEWHGVHNPVGADTLQAEGMANLCARKGGGLAFPPLYYAENRIEQLVCSGRGPLREMELPDDSFAPENQLFTATEQAMHYNHLLIHILDQLDTLGFEVGVLVAGHYPLIDYARAAVLQYNQRNSARRNRRAREGMLAWAFVDFLLVRGQYDCAGDHGGGWETSHVMALHPDTVDLSLLPPKGEKLIGCGGRMAPQDANAPFGAATMEAAADIAVQEVKHRLEHRAMYTKHGRYLQEGLWKSGS